MEHRVLCIILFVTFLFPHLVYSTPSVTETLTLTPIACKCVSNTGVRPSDLVVRFDREKNEWISYMAFNLSEIPSWVSIDYAVFEIKAQSVLEPTKISACCSPDAAWVTTNMTWLTKPELNKYLGDQQVSTSKEWYSWSYSTLETYGCALTDMVLYALAETGMLTIQLRSGFLAYLDHQKIVRISQFGHVIFYSDARLEITYPPTPPTIENVNVSPVTGKSGTIFTISADVNDLSGVSNVVAHVQKPDEFDVSTVTLTDPDGDRTYTGEWNSTDIDDGVYYVDIVSNDTLGNRYEKENGITFRIENVSPLISNIEHKPVNPTLFEAVAVTVQVTDESDVNEVYLHYSVDDNVSWNKVLMASIGNSIYEAIIPKQSEGTTVQYYVEAVDNALNKAETGINSYTVTAAPPVWAMIVAGFILFGISIAAIIITIRHIKRRRKAKEKNVNITRKA